MDFLLLRGAVPTDRNPKEIIFDSIEKTDDVWSLLFYNLLGKNDYGEIWYYGKGGRDYKMSANLIERWIPDFGKYDTVFKPDIIFARGAFKEYHKVFYSYPDAFKIRYGAGSRFVPTNGFTDYDIILQDSSEQMEVCKQQFPDLLTILFVKPAADSIFYPMPDIKKEYDICFPANGSQAFKGHEFVYRTVPPELKLLNLGNNPHNFKYPDNVTSYRVLRTDMAKNIAKCKIGIVAVSTAIDSCPRVIPELLACGLPIVVLNGVRFWQSKYIESVTSSRYPFASGELATEDNFWGVVAGVLANLKHYDARKYYEENLNLKTAAEFIRRKIEQVKERKMENE